MNYPFKIPPFGNWNVADSAMKDVISSSELNHDNNDDLDSHELVGVLEYGSGERKMVFMLPVQHGGHQFVAAFPDPVLLYLSITHQHFIVSEKLRKDLFAQESLDSSEPLKLLDSEVNDTNSIYNSFLQYRVSSIIMLHSSLEAFVNSMIADNIEFPLKKRDEVVYLNKRGIDRQIKFKDKLVKVMTFVSKINFEIEHQDIIKDLLHIYYLRNNFIHLKSYNNNEFESSYTSLFLKMINTDIGKYLNSFHSFVELVKPSYIIKK